MSEMHSAAEAAGVQFDERVFVHHDHLCEGCDDREAEPAEPICDFQNLRDQTVSGLSGLQQTLSLSEKAQLDAPSTLLDDPKLIAQVLVSIPEKSILCSALTAGSDTFKLEKEELPSTANKLREELASLQNN